MGIFSRFKGSSSADQKDPAAAAAAAEVPKSRNPADTAFKQQRLPAWQPLLTPRIVLPALFVVGLLFAPLGGVLLWASDTVREISLDYTQCADAKTTFSNMQGNYHIKVPGVSTIPRWKYDNDTKVCTLEFTLPAELKTPVLLYYQLTNFYQNHRVYVKSFDAAQLRGKKVNANDLTTTCKPLSFLRDGNQDKPYYPCGLIANSMFNDTINNPVPQSSSAKAYEFSPKGIAWPSDIKKYEKTQYSPKEVVPPPNWAARFPQGYTEENMPNLKDDERFIVWMRAAGLPTFRKLYGRNDDTSMPAGIYTIDITMNFDVLAYSGTKSVVISTSSFVGGRNPALGISYIVVGAVCVILGTFFTAVHVIKPRKLGDHTLLSWNKHN
ncbi:CDC50 family protein [Ramicandelaber brevisporus]|nr:CDC50 family protein [Ramicandelaber brevisporus]